MKLADILETFESTTVGQSQFWIRPDGNYLIPCEHYHYITVMMNPGEFGVPAELFEKWKTKAYKFYQDRHGRDEPLVDTEVYRYCVDRSVSDVVMTYIYKQGWMRFDLGGRSTDISLTIWKLDAACRKGVTRFVKNVYDGHMARWISLRDTGGTEVRLHQNYRDVNTVSYSVKDIPKGYLEEE